MDDLYRLLPLILIRHLALVVSSETLNIEKGIGLIIVDFLSNFRQESTCKDFHDQLSACKLHRHQVKEWVSTRPFFYLSGRLAGRRTGRQAGRRAGRWAGRRAGRHSASLSVCVCVMSVSVCPCVCLTICLCNTITSNRWVHSLRSDYQDRVHDFCCSCHNAFFKVPKHGFKVNFNESDSFDDWIYGMRHKAVARTTTTNITDIHKPPQANHRGIQMSPATEHCRVD